jgi:hypothetical protein
VNIGVRIHGQWRHMEGVQKYRSTEVWKYRSTAVQKYRSTKIQKYRCTDVQTNVAIARMVAVGLTKKREQYMYY